MIGDCHIHMILDGIYYRTAIDAHKAQPDETLIRARLQAYRDAGVGFLRDGGDARNVGKRAAEIAPEFGIEYLSPVYPIYRHGRYGAFIGRGFDDMKDFRLLVAEALRSGADFIKIMISGLMDFNAFGRITSCPLTKSEIREMVRVVHGEGLSVMAHANGADTVKYALEAGLDSVEHGAYMDGEALHLLAETGAVWTPTLATVGNLIGCGRYPDDVLKPLLDLQMQNVRQCVELGGKVALGSDAGAYLVPHGKGTMDEYALLRAAIGENTDTVLSDAETVIRCRFHKP